MNSPILEYLASYGIDPAYIMIGLTAAVIILIILYIATLCRMKKFYRAYDRFMRGKNMESMEKIIIKQFDRLEKLEDSNEQNQKQIDEIAESLRNTFQKCGMVKYDAFREMSGKLSYSIALLNKEDNGILLSSMYSREGCYSYVKEIIHGESYINLSEEEAKALRTAIDGDKIEE